MFNGKTFDDLATRLRQGVRAIPGQGRGKEHQGAAAKRPRQARFRHAPGIRRAARRARAHARKSRGAGKARRRAGKRAGAGVATATAQAHAGTAVRLTPACAARAAHAPRRHRCPSPSSSRARCAGSMRRRSASRCILPTACRRSTSSACPTPRSVRRAIASARRWQNAQFDFPGAARDSQPRARRPAQVVRPLRPAHCAGRAGRHRANPVDFARRLRVRWRAGARRRIARGSRRAGDGGVGAARRARVRAARRQRAGSVAGAGGARLCRALAAGGVRHT